ncbi:MAG TPA: MarR family transcriptional regulator [Galbitalea sp.]|jgi:DNA-binding MarR family transcriptional regulator
MQTRDAPTDQLAVAQALERVIAWLRQSRESSGLSASTVSALTRLDSRGSLRITELSELEQLTQPGMTTLINRLEEAGFARREADPDDRRAVRVTITPAGVEQVVRHREGRAARILTRISELPPDDQDALVAALPALRAFAAEPGNIQPSHDNNDRGSNS